MTDKEQAVEHWATAFKLQWDRRHRRPRGLWAWLRRNFRGRPPLVGPFEMLCRPDIMAAGAVRRVCPDKDWGAVDYQRGMTRADVDAYRSAVDPWHGG